MSTFTTGALKKVTGAENKSWYEIVGDTVFSAGVGAVFGKFLGGDDVYAPMKKAKETIVDPALEKVSKATRKYYIRKAKKLLNKAKGKYFDVVIQTLKEALKDGLQPGELFQEVLKDLILELPDNISKAVEKILEENPEVLEIACAA